MKPAARRNRLHHLVLFKLVMKALWGGLFFWGQLAFAQTWTQTSAPNDNWTSIASSADGSRLVAAAGVYGGDGLIYISTNSGTTWMPSTNAPTELWECVASSADGTKLVAATYDYLSGSIYTSTNEGNTWTQQTNTTYGADEDGWNSAASSTDGARLVTVGLATGEILVSTNFGAYWTASPPVTNFVRCVASSASGDLLAIGISPGGIYTSTNSGNSWAVTTAPVASWTSIASSADGNKLVACDANFGGIYVSTNAGATWSMTGAPTNIWFSVASSADGTKLIAGAGGDDSPGPIFQSADSGVTWELADAPSTNWWYAVASSADGNKLFAVDDLYGGIWTCQTTPTPLMNVTQTSGNLALSWIVPSTNFVLEQSSDLQNWSELTNQPCLNLTNLLDETTLPMTPGVGFYRLATP